MAMPLNVSVADDTPRDEPAPAPPAAQEAAAPRAIVVETVRACAGRFGHGLRAVVLTGSLARDEGTFARVGDRLLLLGDAEFLLVFHDGAPLPAPAETADLTRSVERALRGRGLDGKIGLSTVRGRFLRGLGRQIFAHELRACGRVVWGDRGVLALVPAVGAGEIDPADAWTLLCNRLVEQLAALAEPRGPYPTVKLWLDMATSFLVFAGACAPTYGARAAHLAALAATPGAARDAPIDLGVFARRVERCTRFKTGAISGAELGDALSWPLAVDQARQLWRWELRRLTGASAGLSDRALAAAWTSRQPLASRARGWAYAARQAGWHRGWRHWPRWARLAGRGSPRHAIYAAAAELLFGLTPAREGDAGQATSREDPSRLRQMGRDLPLRAPQSGDWRVLAGAIAANYRALVVETRA
jgi:hypothetical protein